MQTPMSFQPMGRLGHRLVIGESEIRAMEINVISCKNVLVVHQCLCVNCIRMVSYLELKWESCDEPEDLPNAVSMYTWI